jgi:membrane-associated phospholipid phosphatase
VVGTKHVARRGRPYDQPCIDDPTYDSACDSSSRFQSFISGHSAQSFTGASLVCAHQKLRGQSPLGYIECATALATASLAASLRIVAERHYFTDVFVGALVGFLAGYVLPVWLFRGSFPAPNDEAVPVAW